MNELEILMRAEAKKKAAEESAKEEIQNAEFEKARKWKKETLEKLSFLKDYGCGFEGRSSSSDIYMVIGKQTIQISLASSHTDEIWRYHLDKPLYVNWHFYSISNDQGYYTLEQFVKALVGRGIVKVEG
jgi:hypothetical protein